MTPNQTPNQTSNQKKTKAYPTTLKLVNENQCKRLLFSSNKVAVASGALLRAIERGNDTEITSCARKLRLLLESYGVTTAELYDQTHVGV